MSKPNLPATALIRTGLLLAVAALFAVFSIPHGARAHFSYSDPRIIHIAEQDGDNPVILIRMPLPLALLPGDWRGREETRLPPFATLADGETVLDLSAIATNGAALRAGLNTSLSVRIGGRRAETQVEQVGVWNDAERPSFGTFKSALAAFDAPAPSPAPLPYFDLTLDVKMSLPAGTLAEELRLETRLGENFQVIDKFGTVIKLRRNGATESQAVIGIVDTSFPAIQTRWEALRDAGLLGAEHIYRGLDHLAMILLIAIAALNWRQALAWATAFTAGHVITLAAGLYGVAPAAAWFIPLVELAIVLSIIAAGIAVFFRRDHPLGWTGLFVIGLIHGYGFAASASEALFAGQIDPMLLASFALGLELCQFAIYALALPLILLADRALPARTPWRRTLALGIAASAGTVVILRLSEASNGFGIA